MNHLVYRLLRHYGQNAVVYSLFFYSISFKNTEKVGRVDVRVIHRPHARFCSTVLIKVDVRGNCAVATCIIVKKLHMRARTFLPPLHFPLPWTRPSPTPLVWETLRYVPISSSFHSFKRSFITPTPSHICLFDYHSKISVVQFNRPYNLKNSIPSCPPIPR